MLHFFETSICYPIISMPTKKKKCVYPVVIPHNAFSVHLVDFQNVTSLLLELLNFLLGVDFLAASLGLGGNGFLQDSSYVRHRPRRAAKVEAAFLLDVGLDNAVDGLAHSVLDVNLLRLVTREGASNQCNHASIQISLPFLAVEVFFALVARAEVEEDGADFLALSLLHGAVLDKSAERSETSTETGHDERRGILDGQLHDGRLDGDCDLGAGSKAAEVPCGMTVAGAALGVNPVDDDNHESDRVGSDGLSGGNRVFTTLERADNLDEVLETGTCRLELLKDVDIVEGVDLGATLELFGAGLATEGFELLLLSVVSGELGQGLVEALGRLAENVNVLDQRLVDSAKLSGIVILAGRYLDQLGGVEAVELDELIDVLLVVLGVDAKSFTNLVGEAGGAEVELNVEDVTVVVLRSETTVLLDGDSGGLDSNIGAERGAGVVGLLEDEALGSNLPVAQLNRVLSLLLVKGDEAVDGDRSEQRSSRSVNFSFSPGSRNLELAKALLNGIDALLEGGRCALSADQLANVLSRELRAGNFQERQLDEKLGSGRVSLEGGRVRNVENEESCVLLLNGFAESSRETLLDVVRFEVGELNDNSAVGVEALEHINILEKLLLANDNDIGIINIVSSLESLLGDSEVGTDKTTLGEVVIGFPDKDVGLGVLRKGLSDNGGGADSRRAVDVPESVLFSGNKRGESLSLAFVAENFVEGVHQALWGDGLRCSIFYIDDLRLFIKLAAEGHSSQNIAIQCRLGSLILDTSLVNLAKDGDGAGRGRDCSKEGLLNKRSVNTNVDDTNLGALASDLSQYLLGNLSLGATESDKHNIRSLVAMVLEWSIDSAQFIVEDLEKFKNLTSVVQTGVQLANLGGKLVVQFSNVGLTEGINNAKSLATNADTVIDVQCRSNRGKEGSKQGHVLGFVGGRASDKAQTEVLNKSKSGIVVGNEAMVGAVVGGGDVSDEWAGNAV